MGYSILKILRVYAPFALHFKWRILFMLFLTSILVAEKLIVPYILRDLLEVLSKEGTSAWSYGISYVIILGCLYGISTLVRHMRDVIAIEYQLEVIKQLQLHVFCYLHGHSVRFFQNVFPGSLVKQANGFADAFETIDDQLRYYFAPSIMELVVMLIMLWHLSPMFGVLTIGYFVIFFTVTLWAVQKRKPMDEAATRSNSVVSGRLSDSVINNVAVKSNAALGLETMEYGRVAEASKKAWKRAWTFDTYVRLAQNLMLTAYNVLLFALYVSMSTRGLVAYEDVVVLIGLNGILTMRMLDLGGQLKHIGLATSKGLEVVEHLETPHEVTDKKEAKELVL